MRSVADLTSGLVAAVVTAALFVMPAAADAGPVAVEFFHAGYGHYFITVSPSEIAALDAGTIGGWQRTGQAFQVFDLNAANAANVCRFWSGQTFAPKSSHFYTPFAFECAIVRSGPVWQYEGDVFALAATDAGACGAGTQPLYRLYNDGQGGAPNHRYTISSAIRAQMIAQGWVPEGAGVGVIGCVPAPSSVTIVTAGDMGQCPGPPATSGPGLTAALVAPADELVLTLGDHAYEDGTAAEFAECFDPTWGAFKPRIRPAPGNHDYNTPGATGYFGYFGALAGPPGRGYYSFDYAGWHFVSLDSLIDTSPSSPQYQWLVADLAASTALCTIAYWHFPLFNSGAVYGGIGKMRAFFDVLHSAGVEIVLNGHEHVYERFAPQDANGVADPVRGVREFLVGTGGHSLNAFAAAQPNSEFRYNAGWGVLRLTLREGAYDWAFVPAGGGAALDRGTGTCHP